MTPGPGARVRRPAAGLASAAVLAGSLLSGFTSPAGAQVTLRDLVITGGMSVEGYQGNLEAAAATVTDSAEAAVAGVGELAARGTLDLLRASTHQLSLSFDGGIRQFAAAGFEVRDYAPRELVGSARLSAARVLGTSATLLASADVKARSVTDRPPMPLYIQPAHRAAGGSVGVESRPLGGAGVRLRAEVMGEASDYRALPFAPQLALLDRTVGGAELGAEWGVRDSAYRLYAAVDAAHYRGQRTGDADDPFRRDRTFQGGVRWTRDAPLYLQVGVEGTVNRSNSRRPEYNAASVNALLSTGLPARLGLTLYTTLTAKRYVHPTEFARLIPGEEADNASVAYLSLSRPLAGNLDGTLRLGWTRAETEIGDAYFQRYGLTFLMNYRPGI